MVDVNNMKYTDFEILCEKIKDCLNEYDNSRNFYQDTDYNLYLSNGNRLSYSIPKKSVAHLLGINTEEIKLWNIYQTKSSYFLLNLICNDSYSFHNAMRRCNKSYSSFISPYIDKKIDAFGEHFNSAKDKIKDIEFICKYNRNYSYINGEEAKNIDYLIATKKDNYLTILGLIYERGQYVPVTSQILDLNTEEGKKSLSFFINSQVLTLPETLKSIKGYKEENGFLLDNEFLDKLSNLNKYVSEYGCIIDVSHSLEYTKKKEIDNRNVITAVCESIISGQPVKDINFKGKVPKYIEELLLYIGSLTPRSRKDEIKKLEEYRNLLIEFEKLKKENNNLRKEVKEKNSLIIDLRNEKSVLQAEINDTQETFERISDLVGKKLLKR